MNKLGHHRTRFKVQRALGLELPGLGKAGALDKRNYLPGQHGKTIRRKTTEFGQQMREKQKLLFHYCIREEQLRRFVRKAQKQQSSEWMNSLVSLLERRLDNLVFRLGFARSILAARQLVSHGHIHINGRRETIGSMVVPIGARIALSLAAREFATVQTSLAAPRLTLPTFLTLDDGQVGTLQSAPGVGDIPFAFTPSLVAEYYAKRGV